MSHKPQGIRHEKKAEGRGQGSRIAQPKGSPCVYPTCNRYLLATPCSPLRLYPLLSLSFSLSLSLSAILFPRFYVQGFTYADRDRNPLGEWNSQERHPNTDRNTCVKQIRVIALPVCHNPLRTIGLCLFILFPWPSLSPRYRCPDFRTDIWGLTGWERDVCYRLSFSRSCLSRLEKG